MKPFAVAALPLVLSLILGLGGCGQKGPLFLPGENPNPPQPLLDRTEPAESPDTATQAAPGPGKSAPGRARRDTNPAPR